MTPSDPTPVELVGAADSERLAAAEPAIVAARAADDKKGSDTVVLRVGPVLGIAEFFVITSGANDRQVKAIAEEIEMQVVDAGAGRPLNVEGVDSRQWVLLDYGDMVVHVFREDIREFYSLDRLWSDMEQIEWAARSEGPA
ncbi:MAG: ribosome silencing factor [Acidimicrobiales bacterium]